MKDRKILTTVCLLLALYVMCYGFARWRKCIVTREYLEIKGPAPGLALDADEDGLVDVQIVPRRELIPGHDVRDDWRGRLKNSANPYIFKAMSPLVWVESKVRGTG